MLKRNNLHGYQDRAVSFIKEKQTCNLFLGMSLGKTISTLTALQELYDDFSIHKIIIFAPLRVCQTVWRQESQKWDHTTHLTFRQVTGSLKERQKALEQDAVVTLCNYENIPWLIANTKWDYEMVVFDESTKMKNSTSKRFRALKKVLKHSPYRVNLTGTPSPNGLMDLYGQVWLLDGGARLGWSLTAFRNSYFNVDFMGYNYTPKHGAMKDIQDRIQDVSLSMSTDDYLDLPPLIYDVINSPLKGKLLKQYQTFEEDALLSIANVELTAVNSAVLVGRLRQFSSGAIYEEIDEDVKGKREVIHIHDLKLEMLDEIFEENQSEDFIVVYEFKHELERLLKRYPDGEVIDKAGVNIERWNKGEISKLFIHAASAGHGINLQYNSKGNTMIFMTAPWSLELYQQAVARLYRQGNDLVTKVINLTVGAVDLKVARALSNKNATQQELLNALKGD